MIPRRFSVLPGTWSVLRLDPKAAVPAWALGAGGFASITRTTDELSIVCVSASVPPEVPAESGWAALKLRGPFPFTTVGVLASFAAPLAAAEISLFVISTFDTDYILVKADRLPAAIDALRKTGHTPSPSESGP